MDWNVEGKILNRKQKADALPTSKTDWERLRTMTDADIERAVAQDPDAAPILSDEEMGRDYKLRPARIRR